MPSRPANKRRSLSGGQTLSSAYFYLKHTNVFIYFFVRNGHNRQSAEFSTKLAGLHTAYRNVFPIWALSRYLIHKQEVAVPVGRQA